MKFEVGKTGMCNCPRLGGSFVSMSSSTHPLLCQGPSRPCATGIARCCSLRARYGCRLPDREQLYRVSLGTNIQGTGWKPRAPSASRGVVHASVAIGPVSDLVRVCVFYALLQTGIAGRSPILSAEGDSGSLIPAWLQGMSASGGGAPKDSSKVRTQWHASTKGTLVRRYRVPTKKEGRRLLTAISALLSDDDTFRDVSTHKGCQLRRENAHAESVCCNNVRALFDELPTPHLVVEITVFPPGPVSQAHYEKAEKLEKVLKTGNSI